LVELAFEGSPKVRELRSRTGDVALWIGAPANASLPRALDTSGLRGVVTELRLVRTRTGTRLEVKLSESVDTTVEPLQSGVRWRLSPAQNDALDDAIDIPLKGRVR
jgi:hypothetical protein